jgi:formate--tetrahydrofolate ligase
MSTAAGSSPATTAAQVFEQFEKSYGDLGKIDVFGYLEYLNEHPEVARHHGKLVLVTADTPLKASRGEGKTTASVALVDALRQRGIDAAVVLRQPSMGITAAGSKGGASGGGKATISYAHLADWGLFGEMTRITVAQNLLVSFAEKAVDDGLLKTVTLPRVSEVPSRAMRSIIADPKGTQVEEKVVLSPTCEMMQIVTLARSQSELEERIGNVVLGAGEEGRPVRAKDITDIERIVGVLGDAVQPACFTTQEGSPVYMHCGPFGNVSLGIPSLTSIDMACSLHDVVIMEAGYGMDMGGEKYLDIACRHFGAPYPAAALVVTRATTWTDDPALAWRYPFHIQRLEDSGIPAFPLINLWSGEESETENLRQTAAQAGFRAPIVGNLFVGGGEGIAAQLDDFIGLLTGSDGENVVDAAERSANAASRPFEERLLSIIATSYGVPSERVLTRDTYPAAVSAVKELCEQLGVDFDQMPILPVKSPATMTDDDTLPESERTVTLKKAELHAGARLVHVNLTTSLTTPMPKIV